MTSVLLAHKSSGSDVMSEVSVWMLSRILDVVPSVTSATGLLLYLTSGVFVVTSGVAFWMSSGRVDAILGVLVPVSCSGVIVASGVVALMSSASELETSAVVVWMSPTAGVHLVNARSGDSRLELLLKSKEEPLRFHINLLGRSSNHLVSMNS